MTEVLSSVAKIYIQGPLKKNETDFYTLLPTMLSLGFTQSDIVYSPYIEPSLLSCESMFNVYDPFLQRGAIPPFTSKAAHLHPKEVVQMLNFASILQNANALPNPASSAILIFDSKTVARRDFIPRLKDMFEKEAYSSWECLSLAHSPTSFPNSDETDKSFFSDSCLLEQEPMTPITSGALALRLSYVNKLVKTILPFRDPLDFELIFQTLLHKTKPYYIYPPLFYC